MNDEHLMLYLKLQNLYVDTYENVYSCKNYFKALEQFSMIYHAIDDYTTKNNINIIILQMFNHLKDKCQKNINELNNYLYTSNDIVIEEGEEDKVDIEDSLEDIVIAIDEPSTFSTLIYRLFPCISPSLLDYYLFKKLFTKEKND